jgi:hypothetical protein
MRLPQRTCVLAASLLIAGGVLAGCVNSEEASTAPPTPAAPGTPAPAAQGDTGAQTGGGKTIDITYRGGKVTPKASTVDVPKGSKVTVKVTSDVADKIDLKGYPSAEIGPGKPGELSFTPNQPGDVQVILHTSGKKVVTVHVG